VVLLGGFREIIRVEALAKVLAAVVEVVERVVSGVGNRETQIERLEVRSDVCQCGNLGRCEFFIYLTKVIKETKQIELSFGNEVKTRQGEVDPSWERNEKDQGHTQNIGDEKISRHDWKGGGQKIIRAFWNRKDAQQKRHFGIGETPKRLKACCAVTTAERIKGTSRERRVRKQQGYSERKRQNREITSQDQGDAKEKTKVIKKIKEQQKNGSDAERAWKLVPFFYRTR